MLALTKNSRSASSNGASQRLEEALRGTRAASPGSRTSSSSTANSSPPRRAIVSAGRRQPAEPLGDRDRRRSPGAVPEAVVDRLEAVEVAEQHGDRRAGSLGAGNRMAQAVDEQRAVGQAGERVVKSLVHRFLDRSRVVEGEARVLGEGEQHLLVAEVVLRARRREPTARLPTPCRARSRVPPSPPSTRRQGSRGFGPAMRPRRPDRRRRPHARAWRAPQGPRRPADAGVR